MFTGYAHRMNKRVKIILTLMTSLSACQVALADSDGMFCQGERFMAYELQHFDSEHPHTLYILRPSVDEVVSVDRHLIPAAIGQVHGLKCEADKSVLISAFDRAIRFDLSDRDFTPEQKPEKNFDQSQLDTKLHHDERPVTVLSSWSDETYNYELHRLNYIFPETGSHDGIIEHHSVVRIVRVNKMGYFFGGSYTILETMKIETID